MRQFAWLLLSMALTVGAQTSTNNYETLQRSQWFAVAGGFGNAATPEAFAVAAISEQPNATATFQRLLGEPGQVQRLYGLLGLRLLNAPEFKTALPVLLASKADARVLIGCIAGERETAEIARRVRDHRWSIRPLPVPGGKYAPGVVEK